MLLHMTLISVETGRWESKIYGGNWSHYKFGGICFGLNFQKLYEGDV